MRLPARLTTRLTVLATALLLAAASTSSVPASADPLRRADPAAPVVRAGTPSVTTYAVPTAGAGLGRITTAPDGNLWFVERTAHKIGRVTVAGQIGETAFPSANPGPQLIDLDVAPNGLIWVVYDSGRLMIAVDSSGTPVRPVGGGQGFSDALAGSVRVAPDGVVWNAIGYPASGTYSMARTFATGPTETPADASPACDGPLGVGSDGAMWCRSGDAILRLANPPQGSATLTAQSFLAGAGGLVPRALAAGPVGSIWFTRYAESATANYRGEVGYLDQATGAVRTFPTGPGSAPSDLRAGPDGRMWFVNGGTTPGIGYVDATGQGGLLRFGNAVPTSLTFARDGALWFTDATNNTLTRVVTTTLPDTTGVTGTGKASPKTGARSLRVRKNTVPVVLTCAPTAVGGCTGAVRLRTSAKVRKPGKGGKAQVVLTRKKAYALAPGSTQKISLKLTRTGRAVVRRGKLSVRVEDGAALLAKLKLRR